MSETVFVSSSEDEIFGAPTAESDELEALYAARDAEVEAATPTRAHLAQFKKWIVEDEPEPPELLCARIDTITPYRCTATSSQTTILTQPRWYNVISIVP